MGGEVAVAMAAVGWVEVVDMMGEMMAEERREAAWVVVERMVAEGAVEVGVVVTAAVMVWVAREEAVVTVWGVAVEVVMAWVMVARAAVATRAGVMVVRVGEGMVDLVTVEVAVKVRGMGKATVAEVATVVTAMVEPPVALAKADAKGAEGLAAVREVVDKVVVVVGVLEAVMGAAMVAATVVVRVAAPVVGRVAAEVGWTVAAVMAVERVAAVMGAMVAAGLKEEMVREGMRAMAERVVLKAMARMAVTMAAVALVACLAAAGMAVVMVEAAKVAARAAVARVAAAMVAALVAVETVVVERAAAMGVSGTGHRNPSSQFPCRIAVWRRRVHTASRIRRLGTRRCRRTRTC